MQAMPTASFPTVTPCFKDHGFIQVIRWKSDFVLLPDGKVPIIDYELPSLYSVGFFDLPRLVLGRPKLMLFDRGSELIIPLGEVLQSLGMMVDELCRRFGPGGGTSSSSLLNVRSITCSIGRLRFVGRRVPELVGGSLEGQDGFLVVR